MVELGVLSRRWPIWGVLVSEGGLRAVTYWLGGVMEDGALRFFHVVLEVADSFLEGDDSACYFV